MTNPIQHAIESRVSTNHFQPGRSLADDIIASLVAQATRAPSAFNMQNWRFIAVRSVEAKARLRSLAYDQQKVMDASVAFIVCGTLAAHAQLAAALQPSVSAGIMEQDMVDGWVALASAAHEGDPVLQRDEAIRSASLAAMTLMLAAQGMELGSCAMVGFDAAGVSREFHLDSAEIPVVIVTVGYPAGGNWPQKPRKPLPEILTTV
ncbi:nitroreductase family protein [Pseudomonas sp. L-22-4S-12]|uniref:nitroreductase family protein n=1 Tax=Pseudomonas sp. L-22-4S-12 TaxID=2610893 RepID=UPI00132A228E|nr:nitroreductase family protein [Pseudomonas sp. L-22-4S-12]MWV18331.1 nitroreductase family protein [Pseudomonas sp. L-22-4S-12]